MNALYGYPREFGGQRLKMLGVAFDKGANPKEWASDGTPVVGQPAVRSGYVDISASRFTASEQGLAFAPIGSVLINSLGSGTVGRAAYVDSEVAVDGNVLIARTPEGVDVRFLAYCLNSAWATTLMMEVLPVGATNQRSLIPSVVGSIRIPYVPRDTQSFIADFLDSETSRLDAVMDKKRTLMQLLEERKAALVTRVVTRGLNPAMETKTSGVAWLGGTPDGCEKVRIRHLISRITSGSRGWAKYYSDTGDLFLRSANTSRNHIELDLSSVVRVQPPPSVETTRTLVRRNDVVVAITGANVGCVAIVEDTELLPCYVSQHLALISPKTPVSARWLVYTLLSQPSQAQFDAVQYGGTKTQLGLEDVMDLYVAKPPTQVQKELVRFLDLRLSNINQLVSKTKEQISNLAEYRQSLITDAVSGDLKTLQLVGKERFQALEL